MQQGSSGNRLAVFLGLGRATGGGARLPGPVLWSGSLLPSHRCILKGSHLRGPHVGGASRGRWPRRCPGSAGVACLCSPSPGSAGHVDTWASSRCIHGPHTRPLSLSLLAPVLADTGHHGEVPSLLTTLQLSALWWHKTDSLCLCSPRPQSAVSPRNPELFLGNVIGNQGQEMGVLLAVRPAGAQVCQALSADHREACVLYQR